MSKGFVPILHKVYNLNIFNSKNEQNKHLQKRYILENKCMKLPPGYLKNKDHNEIPLNTHFFHTWNY